MLLSFKELLSCSIKPGLSGGQYSTPTKTGFELGKKMFIKMLSMLGQKLGLWL